MKLLLQQVKDRDHPVEHITGHDAVREYLLNELAYVEISLD